MDTREFLKHMAQGLMVEGGSEAHQCMSTLSQEAIKITMELNTVYHTPEEIVEIFSELTGKPVDKSFRMFPPFYTDCGKNIYLGKNVFLNSCCCFQDQAGIIIGDNVLVGHKVVFATLNHNFDPAKRQSMIPKPIIVGKNVWIGANATILGGVTIGENAVVAAGAVVTKDVPANSIAAGIPAKVIKSIYDDSGELV